MRDLIEPLRAALADRLRCAWCTVVEARGSTPQKAGAAMLVLENGRQFGTLGGGCVEAEVRQRALASVNAGDVQWVNCSLDSEATFADGLICGGRMRFAVQPLSSNPIRQYFSALVDLFEHGGGGFEVIAMPSESDPLPRGRAIFAAGNVIASLFDDADAIERIRSTLPNLDDRPKSRTVQSIAVLPILPRCRLIIVGAGHVGQAVADLAAKVDFDLCVVDDRSQFAHASRFPDGAELMVGEFARILGPLSLGPRDYCLIATRGHGHDAEALFHVVGKPARYIGLIGSRRKIRGIFEDLERNGITREDLAKVHAPIGLDIGSQTVPEIALSIVAQLLGHRNLGPDRFPPQAHFGRTRD